MGLFENLSPATRYLNFEGCGFLWRIGWILTQYFELRLRWGSLENRALLTQCFKLRQLLVSLANRWILTQYFELRLRWVAFENLSPLKEIF